jgi:hypothetical protein
MNPMLPSLVLVLSLAPSPLRAQVPIDIGHDAAAAAECSFGISELDGEPWALGPAYKARFDAHGFRFVPALTRNAQAARSLSFALDSIALGGVPIYGAPDAGVLPTVEGKTVRYARGAGITEAYEARRAGLEQYFVFESLPPAAGDLVVRGRILTDLVAVTASPEGGLRFEAVGEGGVEYGAALGIDARGRTSPASLSFDGDSVEMRLPASFVRRAALPLVLDPLVGAIEVVDDGANDDERPDVAYDATQQTYLVVWQRYFALNNIDIRAQRLDIDGIPDGAPILVESVDINERPAVGDVNDTNRFLVVWQRSTVVGGTHDVLCRAVNGSSGAVSAATTIAGGAPDDLLPDVGGESHPPDRECLVVWKREGTGIRGQLVRVPGSPLDPSLVGGLLDVSTGADDDNPAVTKSGSSVGRWLVVWERFFAAPPPGDNDLRARLVDRDGTFCTAVTTVLTTIGPDEHLPSCAGDGTDFLVVWERDFDLHCATASHAGPCGAGGTLAVGTDETLLARDADLRAPAVEYCGREYVVAYLEEVSVLDGDLYVVGVDPVACTPCEKPQLVAGTAENEARPAVAAQRSAATGEGPDVLIAWMSEDTGVVGFESDIYVHLYRCTPGFAVINGAGCGNGGGFYEVTCAGIGASGFTHLLSGALPGSPAALVIGFSLLDFSCGTCLLRPSLDYVAGTATSGTGSASVVTPIPDDPALIGAVVFGQWAVFHAAGACALFGIDASNALQIVVGV